MYRYTISVDRYGLITVLPVGVYDDVELIDVTQLGQLVRSFIVKETGEYIDGDKMLRNMRRDAHPSIGGLLGGSTT